MKRYKTAKKPREVAPLSEEQIREMIQRKDFCNKQFKDGLGDNFVRIKKVFKDTAGDKK